jgi:hypothetical protein
MSLNSLKTTDKLNILSLNVCGLKSKCNYPEFTSLLNNYDIIGLQETKLDNLDHIEIANFKLFFKNRTDISNRKSGGIAIAVKKKLLKHINIIETDCKSVFWFTLSKQVTLTDRDVLYGVVYIPPENSVFAVDDPFVEIQNELSSFSQRYNHICIFGDFNCRTSCLNDYIVIDRNFFEVQNLNEVCEDFDIEMQRFDNCNNISKNRVNTDVGVNNYGKIFIDFLQMNYLYILNGRTKGDQTGKTTCKGVSCVDYFVCSSNMFNCVDTLEVKEFCPLMSDVHNAISISFNFTHISKSSCSTLQGNTQSIRLWDNAKRDNFENALDPNLVNCIYRRLCDIENTENFEPSSINDIVKSISDLFMSSAEKTFGLISYDKDKFDNPQTPKWFGFKCKKARKDFHRAKYMYKLRKNNVNKANLEYKCKIYKNTMKTFHNKFKNNNIKRLRKLGKSDPKTYWKIINGPRHNNNDVDINELHDFFKNVNYRDDITNNNINVTRPDVTPNNEIDNSITKAEIEHAVKNLKNNKACGYDKILNEHIKSTLRSLIHIYVKLFNIVFESGIVPESWTIGVINPIYKNKGDITKPENYRPITLLSCLGKLFTSIINNRLTKFMETNNLLNNCQAGFRKNQSTSDHIFVLHSIISILNNSKKKLFCAFVDLKQAFDTVWREGLWEKLIQNNINGKCLNIIMNMYKNIKSCVKLNATYSNFFISNIGVRQGENLSPLLFSIFLNDLYTYFAEIDNIQGVEIYDDLQNFLKMYILLYADDTVILSEHEQDFQTALNAYEQYCDSWKLTVNLSKTKIVIFSKGRQSTNYRFFFKNDQIEIVNEFKYLGVIFTRNGSFLTTKKHLATQATRAMYSLIRNINRLELPIDLQIDLFKKTIKPILLFGAEIWGFGKIDILERVQLRFLKYILKMKRSTPNSMVYGETGCYPLSIDVEERIISFWSRICICDNLQTSKLSTVIYQYVYNLARELQGNNLKLRFPWIHTVKYIFIKTGLINIWESHSFPNHKWLKLAVRQKLKDLFINDWASLIDQTNKCSTYKIFKHNFGIEKYLSDTPKSYLFYIIRFRTRNHRLPVETGSWSRIDYNLRYCNKCQNQLGDEFHYLFQCPFFENKRKMFIKRYFYQRPNTFKMNQLFNTQNRIEYLNLCKFVKAILHET